MMQVPINTSLPFDRTHSEQMETKKLVKLIFADSHFCYVVIIISTPHFFATVTVTSCIRYSYHKSLSHERYHNYFNYLVIIDGSLLISLICCLFASILEMLMFGLSDSAPSTNPHELVIYYVTNTCST